MRVVLTNFGTLGDAYPYLALAVELQRHGYSPVLALPPTFAPMAARYAIPFRPVGPDLQAAQHAINKSMQDASNMADPAVQMRQLFAPLSDALPQMLQDLIQITRNADLLVSGAMQPAGRMVHELTGIPFVSVQVAPFGSQRGSGLQDSARKLINPFRASLGLPPLDDPLIADANSSQLALYAMSRHVIPPPNEWPAHYHMTGYFVLNDDTWQPPPALVEFLNAGEPPVVFSFGSMTHNDPAELTELLLAVVAQVGCRAILQQGWSGLGQRPLPPSVYALGYLPHDWLFPHAACVVLHGGAGTTGAVLRAGVPGVFVPHVWDQPTWAELAAALGCAGAAVPFTELSVGRLAGAISTTLHTPRYAQRAAALGQAIRAEQGVTKARHLIEQFVAQLGLEQPSVGLALDAGPSEPSRPLRRKDYLHKQRTRRG